MRLSTRLNIAVLAALIAVPLAGQGRPQDRATPERDSNPRPLVGDTLVVTHGQVRVGGASIAYTASTGLLPIRNQETAETEGQIFYVAYTKDGVTDPATRPVTFLFNGGPGSASVWLHLGAFGPMRVHLNDDGTNPPPPYSFEPNPNTLLDQTDMVFIDPVGTGFSRATTRQNGPKFWGLDQDMHSVAEFIRLWLTRNERWASPRFVGGESYGTTRAAHLSGYLTDNGIALNGVILISTVLNFEALRTMPGNDLAYLGFMPSYATTAWYHHRLPPDLQALSLEDLAHRAEQFTMDTYAPALLKGAAMSDSERQSVAEQIARFTGTTAAWVLRQDLRPALGRFSVRLLQDQRLMTGRLDSRFTAFNPDPGADGPAFDPSNASIRNSFTPVLNDYVRRVLHYRSDDLYYILGGGIGRWEYPQGRFANVAPSLEHAFDANPDMKLYVAMGYYDMATTYFSVQYTLDHLTISPDARAGIVVQHFPAGHMMYIDRPSMDHLASGLRQFIRQAVPQR